MKPEDIRDSTQLHIDRQINLSDEERQLDDIELIKEMNPFNKAVTLGAVIIPFLFTIGTFFGMWVTASVWATSWDLIIFLIMYNLVGVGVTVGFHRLLTHGSFKTYPIIRYIFACLGTMSVQGSVLTWVADHRKHHKFTDRHGDPHSPHTGYGDNLFASLKGLYHAHVGWLLKERELADWRVYAKDLYEDPGMRFITRNAGSLVLLGLLIPTLLGWVVTGSIKGALSALLWGGLVRICFLHHVTWSINSICHFHGSRDFSTNDRSTNVFWLTLVSFGECWHNNHHALPRSAVHGVKKWQIDSSYMLIQALERVRLAWDVVRFDEDFIHRRKKDC